MRHLLGQRERLVTPLQGLVWIAQYPQGQAAIGEATHPEIIDAIEEGRAAVLLGIVEGYALREVRLGRPTRPDTRLSPAPGAPPGGRPGRGRWARIEELLRQRPAPSGTPPA